MMPSPVGAVSGERIRDEESAKPGDPCADGLFVEHHETGAATVS